VIQVSQVVGATQEERSRSSSSHTLSSETLSLSVLGV
jgi:hypothetical protein